MEQDNYVIDVFDGATGNADEAYLTSHECETFRLRVKLWRDAGEQVERYCRDCRENNFAASQAAGAAFGYDGVSVV